MIQKTIYVETIKLNGEDELSSECYHESIKDITDDSRVAIYELKEVKTKTGNLI